MVSYIQAAVLEVCSKFFLAYYLWALPILFPLMEYIKNKNKDGIVLK